MKLLTLVLIFTMSVAAFANDIQLRDYNYTVSDIAQRGLTKERIFQGLNRDFLKLGSSICSNRALIWAYDMQRQYRIGTAKIFLFYTEKTGEASDKTWWYHVAPLVNEGGELWVVDGGFPRFVRQPMLPMDWLNKFVGSNNCKEIRTGEEDLIERMFKKQTFPENTRYGNYDCYYHIAAAPLWTPSTVAQHLLQRDRSGNPINFYRQQILTGELMQACVEASTTPIGGIFSKPKKKCREYLGIWED